MTKEWLPSFDPQDEPFYQTIVSALEGDIEAGRLSPGDRLPTQRWLAQRLGVALGTVTRAYGEAESRGLIRGEGRRGTFVGTVASGRASLASLVPAGAIDLGVNYPAYCQDPQLGPALSRLLADSWHQDLLRYPSPEGRADHRAAGVEWLRTLGFEADVEGLLVTAGAQHAIAVAIASVARSGDTILAGTVTFPGIKAVADMLGLRLLGVPMDGGGLLPDALDSFCRRYAPRALYCMPTLQNPTQVSLSAERRQAIVEIARRHDLILVEDAIHRALRVDPPPLLATLASERTMLLTSLSKVVAAGLRVGFLAVPRAWRNRVSATLQATLICGSPLTAEVFRLWLEDGTIAATIRRRRREARARHRLAAEILSSYPASAANQGHLLWLPLPASWPPSELALELRRRGVTVAPAETFSVPPSPPPAAIRLCLGTTDRESLARGLEILEQVLAESPCCGLTSL